MRQHDPGKTLSQRGVHYSGIINRWLTDFLTTKTVLSYAKNCLSCQGEECSLANRGPSLTTKKEQSCRLYEKQNT